MRLRNQVIASAIGATLLTILPASAAVISNPLSLTVTETQFTAFTDFETADTLQTRLGLGLASVAITSANGAQFGVATNAANAVSATNSGAGFAFKDFANPGVLLMDLDSTSVTTGFTLSDLTVFIGSDNTLARRRYNFTLAYSLTSAPTTFIDFLQVNNTSLTPASNVGTRIHVSNFASQLAGVDSIRLSSIPSDGRNSPVFAEVDLNLNVIPEPGSIALASGAAAMILMRRRQRHAKLIGRSQCCGQPCPI